MASMDQRLGRLEARVPQALPCATCGGRYCVVLDGEPDGPVTCPTCGGPAVWIVILGDGDVTTAAPGSLAAVRGRHAGI